MRIPNLGALPIIASVSLTYLPCLFACFYEYVSCVYAVFSTCLSTCVERAACCVICSIFLTAFLIIFFFFYKFNRHLCHGAYWCTHYPANMRKLFFLLHLHSSNSCVCVSKHVYAVPSFSMLIHIYCHIHVYSCFVSCSLCITIFLLSFFHFYKFNRYLCHGAYSCTHNPVHITRLLPICIFISHLPTTSRTLVITSKYTYISQYILLPLLYEPLVPLSFLLCVNSCVCVSKNVYTFPSSSIFIHTYRHIHMYDLCSVLFLSFFLSILITIFFFLSSVSKIFIDTYVPVPIHVRTTCLYAYPLFLSVSSFV